MGKPHAVTARVIGRAKVPTTLWALGYRWTQAEIELVHVSQPHLRRAVTWSDLDLAPEFPVLSDALAQLCASPEWEIASVQVASYDIANGQDPLRDVLHHAVH